MIAPAANAHELADGYFYHTIDLPGRPTIIGAWDLRGNAGHYFGQTDFAGQRVLEIGAANGFLTLDMERRGARVVPFDLSPAHLGDIMRYPGLDHDSYVQEYRRVVTGLNRAFGYSRAAFGAANELVHGSVYALPEEIGMVDISTFGCVLLHLREPFRAIEQVARLTRHKIIVTDTLNAPIDTPAHERCMVFNPTNNGDPCTWWSLTPGAIQQMLTGVGFSRFTVSFHHQRFRPAFQPWGPTTPDQYQGPEITGNLFTVVGERTAL